jgi:hypothetical protein
MAATTESVKADAAEAPLLNKKNMFAGAALTVCFTLGFAGMKEFTAGQLV